MPTPRKCAECGASLPSDAPDGPCPACGLRAALKADPQPAESFHPSALFDPIELGSRRREEVEGSQAAAPPPHTELGRADLPVDMDARQRVPTADEVARASSRAGSHPRPSEGRGQGEGCAPFPNPKSTIGNLRYFGDYELLEEIARGGMGVVYRARQVSLNRTVAVKMILAGQLASAADVQRFRAEAEAAANLQHPNIVAIHEVGEQEGQHYFSMDYVEGKNLAELVREIGMALTGPSGSLAPSEGERAGVMGPSGISTAKWLRRAAGYAKTISEAIQYAHDQGTLHRDLKPSNVLIDTHDQPRITDFGLAKRYGVPPSGGQAPETPSASITSGALPAKAGTPYDLTLSGQVLGSPNFMPPEQAAGKRGQIGPHSDVYSIGAILYHLLTARPPFLAETLTETLQQVQHSDPIAPRLLNPAAPRDLETICLKCLEKEPRQRYATAQALADDLGRYLNSEPVHARPVGPAGKAARWCRRKPALAGALAACLLVLASGIAGITWQWRRAEQNAKNEERQRQRAEANAAKSQQVAQFLKDMLKGVQPSVALGRDTKMLREILDKTAERLGEDLKGQPAVEADVRETIGQVYLDLGDYAKAEAMARQALSLYTNVLRNQPLEMGTALHNLATVLEQQGKYADAEALFREALAKCRNLVGNEHPKVGDMLNGLAGSVHRRGNYVEAEALWRQALAINKRLLGNEHPAVACLLNDLAWGLQDQGKYAEAEDLFRQALGLRRKLLGNEHPDVATSLNNLAWVLDRQRKYSEAEELYREALAMRKRLLGNDHLYVAYSLGNLGLNLKHQGKYANSEEVFREALATARKTATNDPARYLLDLADALYQQQKYAQAEPLYREMLQSLRARYSATNDSVLGVTASLAHLLSDWAWAERDSNSQVQNLKPEIRQRAYEAEVLLRDCLAGRLRSSFADHWRVGELKTLVGAALVAAAVTDSTLTATDRESKFAEAETFLLEGNERLQRSGSADRKYKRDALERLVRLYEAWEAAAPNTGKTAQAEEGRRKLKAFDAEGVGVPGQQEPR